jgi:hypothetical protein
MASGTVSIPSSVGSATVFSVSGTHTLAYAQLFQSQLEAAINSTPAGGADTPAGGSGQEGALNLQIATGSDGVITVPDALTGYTNEAVLSDGGGTNIGASFQSPDGYQFLFDNINGSSTVETASNQEILVAGISAEATIYSNGADNLVVFIDGDNVYDGRGSAGGDTVVAGSGSDSIYTGAGNTSVFSGTGDATIVLNDTGAVGATPNDLVVLEEGHASVAALGSYDGILALTSGQTVFGGTDDSNHVNVAALGGDALIVGNGGQLAVEAYSDGNTVFSGSGSLYFAAGTDSTGASSNTVVGSNSGSVIMFGADGATINYSDDGSMADGKAWFVAGHGNETLNAAGATAGLTIFGAPTDSTGGAADNDSITSGSGSDTFYTGQGNETLTGGAGNNVFDIVNTGSANNILIADFGSSAGNVVGFLGYTADQVNAALDSATTVSGSFGSGTEITFGDGTTVTFIGVSSLTGHTS